MDIAIVTGASSSLGLAVSRRLIQLGFRVYGLGGDYTDCPLQNVNFRPVSCNLADPAAVEAAGKRILEKEKGILVLVNNAKYFGTKSYLEMSPEEMQRVLNINLLSPLVLARTFAEGLMSLQGYIIQLGPLHVESSRGGPTGAAAAGGLKWMSELLFQDLREYGVRVCHLSPEPNRGRDPRTTPRQGTKVTSAIDPEAVAQALEQLLQSPFGNIVTEMVLRPLRVSEPQYDPVVKLPYPKPKPVPYTIPREIIEAEEQLEEEEFRKKDSRRRSRSRSIKKKESVEESAEKPVSKESETSEAKSTGKRKRPDRRSGKKTEPGSGQETKQKPRPKTEQKKQDTKEPQAGAKPEVKQEPAEVRSAATPDEPSRRRRSRRKPRPPKVEVGFHVQNKPEPESSKPAPAQQPAQKPEPEQKEKAPVKKSKRKTATKKTAAKKAATRKTTTKKAATAKKAARKTARKTAVNKDKEPGKSTSQAKKATRKRAPRKPKTDAKSD